MRHCFRNGQAGKPHLPSLPNAGAVSKPDVFFELDTSIIPDPTFDEPILRLGKLC